MRTKCWRAGLAIAVIATIGSAHAQGTSSNTYLSPETLAAFESYQAFRASQETEGRSGMDSSAAVVEYVVRTRNVPSSGFSLEPYEHDGQLRYRVTLTQAPPNAPPSAARFDVWVSKDGRVVGESTVK